MRGDPDREARDLHKRLQKLDRRKSGYLDLAADGDMSRADLRTKLDEVEEQREGLQKALREAEARQKALREPEAGYERLESLLDMDAERLDRCSAEDRWRIYRALELEVHIGEDRSVRVSGAFSPEAYLLDVLQDDPDMDMPRSELLVGRERVVTLDNTRHYTS